MSIFEAMNWKLIFMLSLCGIVTGLAIVFVVPARYESAVSTPIYLFCAYVLARYIERKHFMHGFMVGLLSMTLSVLFCAALADSYVAHHMPGADPYTKMSASYHITVAQAMLFLGTFNILLSALVTGAFAYAAGRIMHKVRGW